MKFPEGKIIAFEGLDNCFKETNFNTFVKHLRKEFPSAEIITESFPRYGNQSCLGVEKWLDGSLDRTHLKNHPEAINSLYAMDRLCYWFESVHGTKRNIDKLYDSDESKPVCFIFDRYTVSNAIYNPMVSDTTTIDDLQFDNNAFGIPQPDIVVWLRMGSFNTFKKLLAEKQNKDANEIDIDFLYKVWKRSEDLINTDAFKKLGIELIVVDVLSCVCTCNCKPMFKTKIELGKEIWKRIENVLNKEENENE